MMDHTSTPQSPPAVRQPRNRTKPCWSFQKVHGAEAATQTDTPGAELLYG